MMAALLNNKKVSLTLHLEPAALIYLKGPTSYSAVRHRRHKRSRQNPHPLSTVKIVNHLILAIILQRCHTSRVIQNLQFLMATFKLQSNSELSRHASSRNWEQKPRHFDYPNMWRVVDKGA